MSDEQELRTYMETEIGGLREDRSTCSYALEFLKTERANRELAQAKANLTAAAGALVTYMEYLRSAESWCENALRGLMQAMKAEEKPQ